MRASRTMVSWVLMVAMLLLLPGRTMGQFECTLGMATAGAACPRCHGHAAAEQTGPAVGSSCCKFVAGESAANAELTPGQIKGPSLARASLLPPDARFGLSVAPDRDLNACALPRTAPRTPTSGYLSDILRL